MFDKLSKASAITPHDSTVLSPTPDAVYVGSGNFTDSATTGTFYSPSVWFRSEEFQAPTSAGTVTAWEMYKGFGVASDRFSPVVDAITTVDVVDGDASTNMQNYVHFTAATSALVCDDHADFNIGTGEFEKMAVVRFEDNTNQYQHIAARDSGANNWAWLRRKDNAGSNPGKVVFAVAGSDPVTATTVPYDTWLIMGVSRNSSNAIQLYRDGATDGAAVTNTADLDADADDNLIIGSKAYLSGYVQSLHGDMAEFIIWETSLSTAERAAVVQDLQDRYFNKHLAQITVKTEAAATVAMKVGVGEITEVAPSLVHSSHTYAGDIVGLNE